MGKEGPSGLLLTTGPRAEVPFVLVRGCWTGSQDKDIRFLVFSFPSEIVLSN